MLFSFRLYACGLALLLAYGSVARAAAMEHQSKIELVQQQLPDNPDPGQAFQTQLEKVRDLRQTAYKFFAQQDEHAAVQALAQELTVGEQAIRAARHLLTDGQMHALIRYLDADGDLLFTMIARHPADPAFVMLGLSYTSARRARFTREQFREFSDWKVSVAREQPVLWKTLREAQDRFTDLSVMPAFTGGPKLEQIVHQAETIETLETKVFESGLLRRVFSMPPTTDIFADMGIDQLIANVNFGKVLIVYIVYDEIRSSPKDGSLERGDSHYLAIVGHAGAPLTAVALGSAAPIDDLVKTFLKPLVKTPPAGTAFDLRPSEELYRKILAPLRPFFKYRDLNYMPSLLIVPDGALLCIPFDVLIEDGTFLIDRHALTLLDSPAEANLIPRTNIAPATTLLALANPTLGAFADAELKPLTQADVEASQIGALWPHDQQQVLHHADATTAALNASAAEAGILYIGSHGFFAPTPIGIPEAKTLSVEDIERDKSGLMASSLARSVIMLAPADAPRSTGLFSGLAVLSLDLSHTQLVVLAACDSGTGDQERGEGIYGLRRAFLEAGAETVVSSLWAVDSAGTREMMVSFYRNLFQGMGRGEALQRAKAFTRLKYPHPHYWAPFVIIGNTGTLHLPRDN